MGGMSGLGAPAGAPPTGMSMPAPLPSMMYHAAGRGGEINPVLAKQQAEALARVRAQELAQQDGGGGASGDKDNDRKRMMADMHSAASDGTKRRKRRWGDESDKANVKAVISQDLTPDQQKACVAIYPAYPPCLIFSLIMFCPLGICSMFRSRRSIRDCVGRTLASQVTLESDHRHQSPSIRTMGSD